jgi:chromosome segregation ATPase
LSEIRTRLRDAEAERANLASQVEAGQSLVESLQQDVAQLREANARITLEASASDRGDALAALDAKIKEKDKAIAILSNAVRKRDGRLKAALAQMDKLREQYDALERQYTAAAPTRTVRVLTDR